MGQDDLSKTWLSNLEDKNADLVYRYLISFHWSIGQFTPAPINYHPVNKYERFFAVMVLLAGLVLFSALLGSVTAIINQARHDTYDRMRKKTLMMNFLDGNHISVQLGLEIRQFVKGATSFRVACTDSPSARPVQFHGDRI